MQWVSLNGASLRYDLTGAGEGTMVLVHEMGGSIEGWDLIVPMLERGRRVLRFDNRGGGLSTKLQGKADLDTLVRDILCLLDHLEIDEPVALIGASVGAAISIKFAAQHPKRVSAMVLLAPATEPPIMGRETALQFADAMDSEGLGAIAHELSGAHFPTRRVDQRATAERIERQFHSQDPHSVAAYYRMMCDFDFSSTYGLVKCPSLIITGAKDRFRTPDLMRRVAGQIPGAEFAIVDGSHYLALETPGPIAEHILEFLHVKAIL